MRAILIREPGDESVLALGDAPAPSLGATDVRIRVVATAVNRADLLQRQGFYPPPPGASDILGLECSGRIAEVAADVEGWSVGDEVCALLAGGGYAERVAVPAGQLMPVPAGVDLVEAGGLPEVACTVWSNLVQAARLARGESVLVHGGASGIGTLAIQVAKALGAAPVLCTASAAKADSCRALGADTVIDYRDEDFVAVAREVTGGRGVDVILDIVGAAYLARNLEALAPDGRLAVIGLQGGATAELDLNALLRKRLTLHAAGLRARPLDQKARICRAVATELWPLVAEGQVRPVVAARFPMSHAAEAHAL